MIGKILLLLTTHGDALALLWSVLRFVFDLVKELDKSGLSGKERMALAVKRTTAFIDDAFDGLPFWGALDEEQRDRILHGVSGIVELAYQARKSIDAGDMNKRQLRKALRKAKRKSRRLA